MKSTLIVLATIAGSAFAPCAASAADAAVKLDIKKAVPTTAFLASYVKENPERAYQRKYMEEAWETFRDEEIAEKAFKLITSRAPKEKLEKFQDAWKEVQEALEPIRGQALMDCKEVVFAETLQGPVNQVLVAFRLTADDAADYQKGVGQLFDLVEKWSDGKVANESAEVGDVQITRLAMPKKSPFQPAVAQVDDLFLVSTSNKLLTESIEQLQDDSAESKFDDERLAEALKHLPAPEDSLVFFDAEQLFDNLKGIGDFIRNETKNANEDKRKDAERGAALLERVIGECAVIDYTVVVEYTEDGQNRVAELGKLSDDYKDKLLGKVLGSGEAFKDWKSWVPADATAYSLSTGVNLHVLYDGIINFVKDEIPESHEALDKFDEMQKQIGVHLDKDILQSFSGESVSLTFPAASGGGSGRMETVNALRCTNEERIGELIERGIGNLKKLQALEGQNIDLVDCEHPEGFKEIQAAIFQMAGANPVYGFEDGWMIIASSPSAAERFLAVRQGDEESIADSENLKKFDLDVGDEAYGASYSNVGESIRQAAAGLEQAAAMAPGLVMMMAAQSGAKAEDIKTINDAIALLPSIAKVVRKFDFMEQRLSILHEGPLPNSYLRESVTLIRQPDGDDDDVETAGG